MANNQIITIKKEISPIISKATTLKIKTANDMSTGTELLSQLNRISDRITEEKEKVTKPLNEALKAERARWKPIETLYDGAISYIRKEMSEYQTEQIRIQREQEEKITKRVKAGNLKMETAVKKLEKLESPEETISTESGKVRFREVKQVKVTDKTKIPLEYFIVDEKKILEVLSDGKTVDGVELETVFIPVNTR